MKPNQLLTIRHQRSDTPASRFRPEGMTMKRIRLMAMALLLTVAAATTFAQVRAEVALRAAMEKETVDGDLKGAIEAYKKIVDGYADNRPVRAQALLRMAECYQKLGDLQARAVYERIIREFTDQDDAVLVARSRLTGQAQGSLATLRQIWTLPPDTFPLGNVSTDGRYLAYNAVDGLSVRDLRDGTTRRVADVHAVRAAFSRDSRQLAYSATPDGRRPQAGVVAKVDLYVVALSQPGTRRKVWGADAWMAPVDWTADGRRVLVATAVSNTGPSGRLALVSVADGTVQVLRSDEPDVPDDIAMSPDGKYIAYDRSTADNDAYDIYIVSSDGATFSPVIEHPADDQLVGWTPAGDGLVFTSDGEGRDGLWLIRVRDGKPQGDAQLLRRHDAFWTGGISSSGAFFFSPFRTATRPSIQTASLDLASGRWLTTPQELRAAPGSRSPDWAPDGAEIAFITSTGTERDAGSAVVLRAASDRRIPLPAAIDDIRWTPDGTAVLALGRRSATGSTTWRIDRASARVIEVPNSGGERGTTDSFAGFTRDGARVYVHRHRFIGDALSLIERDWRTGQERVIFEAPQNSGWPIASVDGSKVYYNRGAEGPEAFRSSLLVERDLSSGRERTLSGPRNHGRVNLSPDGRFIVTGSNDPASKARVMLLVPVDGSPARELMRVPMPADYASGVSRISPLAFHAWAPDSASVILRSGTGGEVWWVAVDGRANPTRLDGTSSSLGTSIGRIAFHPDGRRIAFQSRSAAGPYELWVLENFLTRTSDRKQR